MAAVALQQVRALLQGRKEVKAAVGPAGALALAVLLETDHKHGAGKLLGQPGGHDAHHALVPGVVGQDQTVVGPAPGQAGETIVENIQLHPLPLSVELTQLVGQILGPLGVVRQDEVGGHGRPAHASGGVDAGGETISHGGGVDGPAQGPGLHHEGVQPAAAGLFQVL